MDAITILKDDHKRIEKLFRTFERTGVRANKSRRRLADRMVTELTAHSVLEQHFFYPLVRESVPDSDAIVLESLEEHRLVLMLAKELTRLSPADDHFGAKTNVLIEMVRHHVESEERQVFPRMRTSVSRRRVTEIGEAMHTLQRKVRNAGSGKAMRKAAKKSLKRVA